MRKVLLTLLMCICSYSVYSQIPLPDIGYTPISPSQPSTRSSRTLEPYSNPLLQGQIPLPDISYERLNTIIENGWYTATIKYYNPNTETKSTYTLNVRVFNDRVTAISFGNDGSLHTGINNSGYTYSGGDLTFYQDKKGNIVAADTAVKIYRNGYTTTIEIEL